MVKQLFLQGQKKHSEQYIEWAMHRFKKSHGYADDELHRRLKKEETRVNALVEDSIISERVKRSVISFFIGVTLGLLFVLATGGLGSVLAIIAPIAAGAIAAVTSVATIGLSYQARQKGAMRSVLRMYEEELAEKNKAPATEKVKTGDVNYVPQKQIERRPSFVERLEKERAAELQLARS